MVLGHTEETQPLLFDSARGLGGIKPSREKAMMAGEAVGELKRGESGRPERRKTGGSD